MIDYARLHIRFGWWALLLYSAVGLGLELLHGFKVTEYLGVANETRRLLWTLGHAHGTLLAIVHVIFGVALRSGLGPAERSLKSISIALMLATALLPGGFFLGGVRFFAADPGFGVLLVPFGAALFLAAIFWTAIEVRLKPDAPTEKQRAARSG